MGRRWDSAYGTCSHPAWLTGLADLIRCLVPATAESPVQVDRGLQPGGPLLHQAVLALEERALGIQQVLQSDGAGPVAGLGQFEGQLRLCRCLLLQLVLLACLLQGAEGGVGVDQGIQNGALVADQRILLNRFADIDLRTDAPGIEDRLGQPGCQSPGVQRVAEQIRQGAALGAVVAGQLDARVERRPGNGEVGIGGQQALFAGADVRPAGEQLRGQACTGLGYPDTVYLGLGQYARIELRALAQQQRQAVAQLQRLLLQRRQIGPQLGDQRPLLADRQAVVSAIAVARLDNLQDLLGRSQIVPGQLKPRPILDQLEPGTGHRCLGTDGQCRQVMAGGVQIGGGRLHSGPIAAPEIHLVAGVEGGAEAVAGALAVTTAAPAAGIAIQARQQAGTALAQLRVGLQQAGGGTGQIEVAGARPVDQVRQLWLLVFLPPLGAGPDAGLDAGVPLCRCLYRALRYRCGETAAGQQGQADGKGKAVSSPH